MPQIVPAGLYSPDTYSVYAENFDLSLLPTDGEVPLSPQSQLSDQPTLQSHDYIPATIFHDPPIKLEKPNWSNLPFTSTDQPSYQYSNQLASQQPKPFITVFPPSPTPSIDYTQTQFNIKQEYMDLLPPSPPDSNCAPSPRSDIKSEHEFDTETCIDIDSLLQRSFEAFEPKKQDHQLLREYLLDTTFQRKHNLKPLELDSLFGGWGNRGDIEPVISLALEHAKKDVEQTCATLNISPDPQQWTTAQVQSWLQLTIKQFKLTSVPEMDTLFPEDGAALLNLTDEEFVKRLPQGGGTLHAQLEVWKAACCDTTQSFESQPSPSAEMTTTTTTTTACSQASNPWSPVEECPSVEASDDEDEEMPISPQPAATPSPSTSTTSQNPPVKTGRQGGSHIHLWQFLKELLASPQLHGTAIRWLDRSKGVFKIEDSVRVARLWGRRKNRPAMNYDKLSRSIRQYYKKGIMQKTERSQRLVYQFCHPYCL